MAATEPVKRLASKSDVLVLHCPKSKKSRFTNVQVTVGRGMFTVQTVVSRTCFFRKVTVESCVEQCTADYHNEYA